MQVMKAVGGFCGLTIGLIVLFFFVKFVVTDWIGGEQSIAQIIALLACLGIGPVLYKALVIMVLDDDSD